MPVVFGRRFFIRDVAGNAERNSRQWWTGISDADLGQNKLLEHSDFQLPFREEKRTNGKTSSPPGLQTL